MYGYQLDPGSETQPARVSPPWARPWPPTRLIQSNVLLQFVAGYANLDTVAAQLAAWKERHPDATDQEIADEEAALMRAPIPAAFIAAMKLQVAYLYANRGEATDQKISALAPGVAGLLSYYSNWIA